MSRLDKLKQKRTDNLYYEDDFRQTLELCLPQLKTHSGTRRIEINKHHARIYEHDFYTYMLQVVGIQREAHWIIMRVNDMLSPTDFHRDMTSILVPDQGEIRKMMTSVKTVATMDDF